MKLLVLLALVSSCSLFPERTVKKQPTYVDHMKECVFDLVGRFGIEAAEAQRVCGNIYKRNSK
jgi:hypothetical protein